MVNKDTRKKQIITLISIICFGGSTVAGMVKAFSSAATPAAPNVSQSSESDSLKAQAQGYETVLKREPDNQTALEGLVIARLQLKDFKGGIAPLERLVKLYPERQDYAKQLADAKNQLGDR